MEPIRLAIIIPAYNEQATIKSVITEIFNVLGTKVHVVVVNDCSTDQTSESASDTGAIVLDLKHNQGYAKAIEKGLNYAIDNLSIDYLLTMDADGQHDPHSIGAVYQKAIEDDCDLVIGKRPRCARFSERLYSLYFRLKYQISDPLSGLKLYKCSFYMEYNYFERYDSIGTELVCLALLDSKVIRQVPISIRERQDDLPRFGGWVKANVRIFLSLCRTIIRFGS
jgi:glycosyltransferase involved in cell wall biosynthesis